MSKARELSIKSKFLEYKVVFQDSLNIPSDALVIADSNVVLSHGFEGQKNLEILDVSEDEKNLDSVIRIIEIFQRRKIRRDSRVVFLGGGVIQDLGTFASSIYMRGIDWIYYPTTLQSMIDSCIGSKSSINFGTAKNLIGNYFPPSEIRIWPGFLATLTKDQIVSGLIEGLKICTAGNCAPEFVKWLDVYISNGLQDNSEVVELISISLTAKKTFVEEDEFDQGVRKILNYGHTFGHALESSSNYQIDHGVAVGIGILAAHNLARNLGLISDAKTSTENAVLRLLGLLDPNMNDCLNDLDIRYFVSFLNGDKKTTHHDYVFILPSELGLTTRKLPLTEESETIIFAAICSAIQEVKNEQVLG